MSNIQEYYLHMFFGVNGDNDHYSGAGRIAIAALMAGYGLTGTTKKDLQTRVGWETTPGCFLGQKELSDNSYSIRHRPELIFLNNLVIVRKSGRTLNYALNWEVLDAPYHFDLHSPVWPVIAKIYWAGRFLFGRNVIPAGIVEKLKALFNPVGENQEHNIHNHYVVQFFTDLGIFEGKMPRYVEGSLLPASEVEARALRQPRLKLFLSLALAFNCAENSIGFFAGASVLLKLVPPGKSLREVGESYEQFVNGRGTGERSHTMPMMGAYYGAYAVGTPSVSLLGNTSRLPSHPRDVMALMFCDPTMTPTEEQANGYSPRMGVRVNPEVIGTTWANYAISAVAYEYHLLLTGEELFPLQFLREARESRGFTEELLLAQTPSLPLFNQRNCTLHRLVKFNLDRQNQV